MPAKTPDVDPSGLPIRTAFYCEVCFTYFDVPSMCVRSGIAAQPTLVATHDRYSTEHTHGGAKPAQ